MRSDNLLILFVLFSFSLSAQPDNYLFPINPGERNYLAGTMGELRTNHFHGGIDVRTGGREGLPVYATQDGYISRIKIQSGGYGHALYMTHPDGNTSLYGHLQKFEPALEEFVRNYQYENESYEVQLFPQKDQFFYRKGEVIAYSGNTGSSSGPHLHFEIRDKNQRFMDPLLFGFDEIVDNMIPVVKKVAFVTRDKNARINGASGRYEFDIIFIKDYFTTRKPIELEGNIGIEIQHYDYMDGSWARNGIPEITALIDGDTIFRQQKNIMSFGLNRHILVHTNYPAYVYKRRKFNKLYFDDGNGLDIYRKTARAYNFDREKEYEIEVFLKDRAGNTVPFKTRANNRNVVYDETPDFQDYYIHENLIQFKSKDSLANVYASYKRFKVRPYMQRKKMNYFIYDLRRGLPDSIVTDRTLKPNFQVLVPPGYTFEFFNTDFDIKSYQTTLFDTLYLQHKKSFDSLTQQEIFDFSRPDFPFKNSLRIKLKPVRKYGNKAAVFAKYGNNLGYVGGEKAADGSFSFTTRSLGRYTIAYDTIPPAIVPYSWNRRNLRIKIFDEHSGIKSYRATLDGKFLLMHYDRKKDLLKAVPKNPNTPIKGEFILVIEDNLGNQTEIKRQL